jgi:spore coat protein U-like protein
MRAEHFMIRARPVVRSAASLAAAMLCVAPAAATGCTASTVGVSFADYDPFEPGPLESVGNIHVSCDGQASFTISLSPGAGSFAARTMVNGVHRMDYNLYSDPARLIVWGEGSGNGSTVSVTAAEADLAVYGRVPARQNLPPGSYSDSIVVTITY